VVTVISPGLSSLNKSCRGREQQYATVPGFVHELRLEPRNKDRRQRNVNKLMVLFLVCKNMNV